jgi:ferredoxin
MSSPAVAASAPLASGRAETAPAAPSILPAAGLDALIRALAARGYRVLGPVARDGAIVLDELRSAGDLPAGFEDEQAPGRYRLVQRDHGAFFAHATGPHSFKKIFHVPRERLFQIRRRKDGLEVVPEPLPHQRIALLGARGCDLAAIAIQDRILLQSDPRYAARRADVFVVAVHCTRAGGTCFCASMNTGPRAREPFDMALTEIIDERGHRFLVEVGSARGAEVAAELQLLDSDPADIQKAEALVEEAARSMGRTLDTQGLKERLQQNPEHPRWDDVAGRCLACANCTMVCPTCFCTEIEDTTDLAGEVAERHKRWESCFSLGFSHVHGGSVRTSIKGRYRQWLTHKLASWHDQFDTSGCVGCGRCITFCPVGIDITEEAAAIR